MGNSVSSDPGQREVEQGRVGCERGPALHRVSEGEAPRQIMVCLMPQMAPGGTQSKVPAFEGKTGHQTTADVPRDMATNEGSEKVLLWNCNPSDTSQKDQAYATADVASNAPNSTSTAANLNNLIGHSRSLKQHTGPNFDMHPAVSSDVAGSLPESSSSSSDSDYDGRSYSNEETMPHGPEGSDEETDALPAMITDKMPTSLQGSGKAYAAEADSLAGRLVIHPRNSTTADQVVWVLDKQRLLFDGSHNQLSSNEDRGPLLSPAFILPCSQSPTQQVTTEWCLLLHTSTGQDTNPVNTSTTYQLALRLCSAPPAAAAATNNSSSSDRQAPGSFLHSAAAAAAPGAEVHCKGRVTLWCGPDGTEVLRSDFSVYLQQSGQTAELPLMLNLAPSTFAVSNSKQQPQQQAVVPAAAVGSTNQIQVAVEFRSIRLVQSVTAAAAAAINKPIQQQQQQHADVSSRDQDHQAAVSSVPRGLASATSSAAAAAAAAPARQLEAVLLSTSPRMLVVDGFFDGQLCDNLMRLAEGKLVRSRVASGSETPSRTSWSHFFVKDAAKQALIMTAEAQIEALFKSDAVRGPFPPLQKVEALQVVKYHVGEFYHEHYDNRADSALTRAATIIVYLCDTEEGGATAFPRAVTGWNESSDWQLPPGVTFGPGGQGIRVFPKQGRALIFWSKRADGTEDPNSIHAAETVVKGQKWITTRWMKDD